MGTKPPMTEQTEKSRKLLLGIGIFVLFGVGLFGVAAATGWQESLDAIGRLGPAQIAILLMLSLLNYTCRGLRWHIYTSALSIPTSLIADLHHYLGGFALTATPGRLGELIRLRWIWLESGVRPDRTAGLVLIDRAADLAAVGMMLAACVAVSATGFDSSWTVAIIAIALAIIVTRPALVHLGITIGWKIIGRLPRYFAAIRRASRGLRIFAVPTVFLPATALGVIGWSAEAYAFYLLLEWMGADLSVSIAMAIFFLSVLTGGATGLPGGIGGAEAAMIAALSLKGVPLEIALPATAVIRLTTLWFAILVGIVIFPIAERRAERGAFEGPAHAME